jgi:hypothetical protein
MPEPTYTIWIKTGDKPLGGTDSNVYVMLFGDAGQTEWIFLPPRDAFAFEEGSVDKFVLDAPDVGDLTRCCDVRVRHNVSEKEWIFRFHQWLGEEEAGRLAVCVSLS